MIISSVVSCVQRARADLKIRQIKPIEQQETEITEMLKSPLQTPLSSLLPSLSPVQIFFAFAIAIENRPVLKSAHGRWTALAL